jgi:transposase
VGVFKLSESRYTLSEDDAFYLLNCAALLNAIPAVLEGIEAMHDLFWEKIPPRGFETVAQKCGTATKRVLSEASTMKAPERFRRLHEHLVQGLRYLDEAYTESLAYLTDGERPRLAKALELALLGSAELRDGYRVWERIKDESRSG